MKLHLTEMNGDGARCISMQVRNIPFFGVLFARRSEIHDGLFGLMIPTDYHGGAPLPS
jgi:hypothetical protein